MAEKVIPGEEKLLEHWRKKWDTPGGAFFKGLKARVGKPYTDELGHTWIEVPTSSGRIELFSVGSLGLATTPKDQPNSPRYHLTPK